MKKRWVVSCNLLRYAGTCPSTIEEAWQITAEKWIYLGCFGKPIEDGGGYTCGLCMFHSDCASCPVAAVTGAGRCLETPYQRVLRSYDEYCGGASSEAEADSVSSAWKGAVLEEIAFLLRLPGAVTAFLAARQAVNQHLKEEVR